MTSPTKDGKSSSSPKILFFDLETAPSLGWVWAKWETNVLDFEQEWYILSFVARWKDGKYITSALPDFKGYKRQPENDKQLVKKLWKLFNEADVLIAHNGDKFDVKKANARFTYYNLPPPKPYKTIDTLKVARRHFSFTSNKLDDLGKYLGYGRKIVHTGFNLWQGCMKGDLKSWKKMIRYNKRDVELLEKIYLHFRPWIENHPNLNLVTGELQKCPKCGGELMKQGKRWTRSSVFQQYNCRSCGGWCHGESLSLEGKVVR